MRSGSYLRVVIVDDHYAIREDAEVLLSPMKQFMVVGSCSSVQEAIAVIKETNPDLLLLDISLPDGTGFDILEQIPDRKFKVIFLTAYEEHALKAIKVGALDYLLKPLNEEEFKKALNKVLDLPELESRQVATAKSQFKENSRLVLSSQEHLQIVELSDIIYCQSDAGYTTFYLVGDKKIVTSKYIKEYEEFLPPDQFLRSHASFVVNIKYIDRYHKDDGYLLLRTGTKIPVAARRKETVKNSLMGKQ